MTANVWNPGQGAIPVAQSKQTMLTQPFTAIDAQTVFNLTSFNYTPNTSSLIVAINGVIQIPVTDFLETSGSSFTVTTPLVAGDVVLALGFVGVTATDASLTVIKNATQLLLDSAAQKAIDAANAASAASGSATNAATSETNALGYKNAAAVSASQVSGAFENMRNRIINGNFRVNQRGAGGVSNAYFFDRWGVFSSGGATGAYGNTWTTSLISQNHLVYVNSSGVTKASWATTDTNYFYQIIEGINIADSRFGTADAKPFTFSFRAIASAPNTVVSICFRNGVASRTYVANVTVGTVAATYSVTIPGCTDGVWTTDNTAGITCSFGFQGGSTFTAPSLNSWVTGNFVSGPGASNICDTLNRSFGVTDVQFELGTAATPFQQRPYAQELTLCQRYYEQFMGVALPTANIFKDFFFKVPKRTTPTITLISQSSGSGITFTCNDANRCYQEAVNSVPSNFIAAANAEL